MPDVRDLSLKFIEVFFFFFIKTFMKKRSAKSMEFWPLRSLRLHDKIKYYLKKFLLL